jgi:hypothetical protein
MIYSEFYGMEIAESTIREHINAGLTTPQSGGEREGSITVVKTLRDAAGNTITPADDAVFTVVLKQGETVRYTLTLNKANNWRARANNVPSGDYTAEETAVSQGSLDDYAVSYSPTGGNISVDRNDMTVTVTNRPKADLSGKVTVTKVLQDADGNTITPADDTAFTVVLKQDGTAQYTFTLNKANNWTASEDEVPYGDYAAEETAVSQGSLADYTISYSPSGTVTVNSDETAVTVTNRFKQPLGKITITKVLLDADWNVLTDEPFMDDAGFLVALKQGETVKYTFVLRKANNWTVSSDRIPYGVYTVEETEVYPGETANYDTDYSPPGGIVTVNSNETGITVTNRLRGVWTWDPENEEWIFDEMPPLGNLPQTGGILDAKNASGLCLILLLLCGAVAFLLPVWRRKKKDAETSGTNRTSV